MSNLPFIRSMPDYPGVLQMLRNPRHYFGRRKDDFTGLWRAVVVAVDDPLQQGRVRISLPPLTPGPGEAPESAYPWAAYCALDGGSPNTDAGDIIIPHAGDLVWVMFEQGYADSPVRVGAPFRAPSSSTDAIIPVEARKRDTYPLVRATKTRQGHIISLSDVEDDGEIVARVSDGKRIVVREHDQKTRAAGDTSEVQGISIITDKGHVILDEETGVLYVEWDGDVDIKATNVRAEANDTVSVGASEIEADASATMKLEAAASITVKAPNINLEGNVNIAGNLAVSAGGSGSGGASFAGPVNVANTLAATGNISTSGTISDALGDLTNHVHPGVDPGPSTTGPRT